MAAARALARKGHVVTLLEAFQQPRPLGSGLLLQPSGLAALRQLGLAEQASPAAHGSSGWMAATCAAG